MTQKSLLHAVAAQIANGYETAEVPMYSEQLRMPDRKVIIKIIENLQKENVQLNQKLETQKGGQK